MKDNCFVISINGLAPGENTFLSHADKEFFAKNENYEILDADLKVAFVAEKFQESVEIDCNISGSITVPCDRCLAPVVMPVDASASFVLRLNDHAPSVDEESCEEVFASGDGDILDLNQEVYDYSLLALPLQRFHNDGECDPVALEYLSNEDEDVEPQATETPFSALAEMLNKNKN